MPRCFWGIKLINSKEKICIPLLAEELKQRNEDGFDIYCTANEVSGFGKREKSDLRKILTFFVDLDEGTKQEQMLRIRKGPIPTAINETGRGYQVYFELEDPVNIAENEAVEKSNWFRKFQIERINPFYLGDNQSSDATRIMRVPNFKYWKSGNGKIIIRNVLKTNRKFTVKKLEQFFPLMTTIVERKNEVQKIYNPSSENNVWVKFNSFPVDQALLMLSGSRWCNGERFSFKAEGKGRQRILVNDKPSNTWIDSSGRIGSTEKGRDGVPVAGTIVNWLTYYQHDMKTIAEILKEIL